MTWAVEETCMDVRFDDATEAFRQEVRAWLEANVPKEPMPSDSEGAFHYTRAWQKKMFDAGWAGIHWPKAYGGRGATLLEQAVFQQELARAQAPPMANTLGLMIVGPTLMVHGTEAQKKRYIPRILSAEEIWCQGFSEPNSGSDLASLQTRAVQDGDDFVINGQKIWTSMAHHSQWIFMLARTDPDAPKHRGISYFLVDMQTPGITVKPLIDMSNGHHFNEVYFENVRVSRSGLLGELNRGWYMATTTLSYERSGIEGPAAAARYVRLLTQYAQETQRHGKPMAADPLLRQRLGQLATEVEVARALAWRIASIQTKGDIPGPEAPALKVFGSELFQRIAQTGMQMLGLYGQLESDSKWAPLAGAIERLYLVSVSRTIAAGTSKI